MIKKLLILFLIMIQATLETTSQNVSVLESQFGTTKELKILSWNIYMLPYLSLFNGNKKRAEQIGEKLYNSEYQIIVFQEAFSSVCRGIISKKLRKNYPYQYGPANKKHAPFRTNSGLWIASKIPLEQLDEITFSISKGYDAVAKKGAAIFSGKYNGADFQLITTHLQAEEVHEIRHKQITEMRENLLNKYNSPFVPQIICGDFNIENDDLHNYHSMLTILDATNGEISGDKTTYDEINNTLSQMRTGKRKTIDYVLIRNSRWVKKIERKVNTFFENNTKYTGNLSDHYAIEAEVVFYKNGKFNLAMNN